MIKNNDVQNKPVNPLIIGTAVAAGAIGGAIATALTDKKNRKKVEETLHQVKDHMHHNLKAMKSVSKNGIESVQDSLNQTKDFVEHIPNKGEKTIHKAKESIEGSNKK